MRAVNRPSGTSSTRHSPLNPERETFANVWTAYDPDFEAFHARAAGLLTEHREATELFPQGFPPPSNLFDISSLPWTSFTGFTLSFEDARDHLAPNVTIGRFVERNRETLMPLALQIHHAAADGFHVGRLLDTCRICSWIPYGWSEFHCRLWGPELRVGVARRPAAARDVGCRRWGAGSRVQGVGCSTTHLPVTVKCVAL